MARKKSEKTYGVDLTFWAPKSVSLSCLVGEDTRLEEAHCQAVERTMEFLEEHYAGAEINNQWFWTGNLVIRVQDHYVSRKLDPELHTHCLVLNLTQLPDGRWVDLSYQKIWQNQQLLWKRYHQDLAQACQKLGYELEPDVTELFQLRGYTQEQLAAFSKGGKKSCSQIPPNAMYNYWRQCVEAGGLTSIEDLKNADSRQH